MEIKTRIAESKDASRVAEIYLSSRKTFLPYAPLAHTEDEVRQWIQDKLILEGEVILAYSPKDIVGIISTSHDQEFSWIDNLYLDPEMTGNGIGTLLLDQAKQVLKPPIRLYTFQENTRARKFYKNHGFQEIELSDGSDNEEKTPDVLFEWKGEQYATKDAFHYKISSRLGFKLVLL